MRVLIIISLLYIQFVLAHTDANCPNIISRSRWGAHDPKLTEFTVTPVSYVVIHHSVTPTCLDEEECSRRLVNIQSYHMDERNFDDIAYNFIIGGDGQVYEGVGWHKVGSHTKGWNTKSLGIGFIGDFSSKAPSDKQLQAGKDFIKCGVELGEIDSKYKLLGARSLRPTNSPGLAFYREIQNWRGFTRSP